MGTLDGLLGTVLVGSWTGTTLFMLQLIWAVHYYYHSSRQDGIYFRILVPLILVVDLVGLVAGNAFLYLYCITHWGDVEFAKYQNWTVPVFVVAEALVCASVQGFLVYRYVRLSRNRYVGSVLILFILIAVGAGLATAAFTVKYKAFEKRRGLETPIKLWLVMDAITDVSISLSLISKLHSHRTGIKTTDTMIRRLTILSIQSATIPALCAVGALIVYVIKPTSNVVTGLLWPLPRFYILSLLYTLNVRESLQEEARVGDGGSRSNAANLTTTGPIRFLK